MDKENNGTTSKMEANVQYNKSGDEETVRMDSVASNSPTHTPPQKGCLDMPILFERAGNWWPNIKFDSEILEKQQWINYFPQTRRRFQYALFYIFAACIAWAIYFGATQPYSHHWPYFLIGTLVLLFVIGLITGFTYTNYYERMYLVTSVFLSLLICVGTLLTMIYMESDLSMIGAFTACVEVLLMMYSVIPMPLFITVTIGVIYSIVFEILTAMQNHFMKAPVFIAGKVLLHLCIHLMGIQLFTMRQVRQRSTFWKIGQAVIARNDLHLEKEIKETMIHSLMPPSVAAEVMKSRADKDEEGNEVQTKKRGSKTKALKKGEIIFRTFNMNKMDNVSILFADIVGFTKMSSNKTAEVLVGQLNDLFGRFDVLCTKSGCEKISTLGDCYYCVSGCPEPRPDHAKCCVEMGLGMIEAIKKFDEDNNEQVNMRVGVHTGTVLCGIVGTRRFKFDVWSNDVFLANTMESSGEPGRVHISEASYHFLKDEYEVEPGEDIEDNRSEKKLVEAYDKDTSQYAVKHATWDKMIKTYFILGKKKSSATGISEVNGSPKIDTVVNIEGEVTIATESDTLMNDTTAETSADANGVPTTAMLVSSHLNNNANKHEEKGVPPKTGFIHSNSLPSFGRMSPLPSPLINHKEQKPFKSLTNSPILTRLHYQHNHLTKNLSTPNIYSLNVPYSPKLPRTSKSLSKQSKRQSTKNSTFHSPCSTISKSESIEYCDVENNIMSSNKYTSNNNVSYVGSETVQQMSAMSALSAMGVSQQPQRESPFVPEYDFDPSQEPINKTWTKFRNINYHTDKHIVRCIQASVDQKELLFKPPINRCMLTFTDGKIEENYRDHYMEDQHNQHTLSAPKYHSFLEILVSFLVFTIISIFCFVVFNRDLPWLIFFGISFVLETLNLIRGALTIKYSESKDGGNWLKMIHITSGWYFRNILGAVVASIPLLAVFSNFSCFMVMSAPWNDRFFCFCIVVSLLHFTNFTTLSAWLKSTLAFLAGAVLIVLIAVVKCVDELNVGDLMDNTTSNIVYSNSTPGTITTDLGNATVDKEYIPLFSGVHILQFEIILDMLLLVFLIGFLNRESEISYRLNYHGDAQAWQLQQIMQENKDQADWLLHNIIPPHVSEVVRKTSKYSRNHKDVGVIFAAIVNFNEIYDESFEGGREFIRVLNELVSDYEELLDDERFKDVEKIKTISSTFMAASGLNEVSRSQNKHKYAHLYALMKFCEELHLSIKRFNDSIFNFDFILNIGYNYGEVTAGVIGTTKLLYDIWGDTVNISSRMYSTGVAERTQVPEDTAKLLGDKFEFEYRGVISVKGKGEMKTFLHIRQKPGTSWD